MRRLMFSLLALGLTACCQPPATPESSIRFVNYVSGLSVSDNGTLLERIKLNGQVVFDHLVYDGYTPYFRLSPGTNTLELEAVGVEPVTRVIENVLPGRNTAYISGHRHDLLVSTYEDAPSVAITDTKKAYYRFINLYYTSGAAVGVSLDEPCLSSNPAPAIALTTVPFLGEPVTASYALGTRAGGLYTLTAEDVPGAPPSPQKLSCLTVNEEEVLGKLTTVLLVYNGGQNEGGRIVIVKD